MQVVNSRKILYQPTDKNSQKSINSTINPPCDRLNLISCFRQQWQARGPDNFANA
uniref:Uncharacterized protein n=1 Tax=Arundo donax TaxID=35708 RepID=A0A0A9E8R6_ARUDO